MPHFSYPTIAGIDWKSEFPSIKHILFDKDNTLTLPYKNKYFSSEIEQSVKNAHVPVSVLSNSAGSADDAPCFEHAAKVSMNLGIPVIEHGGRKPVVFDQVMAHVKKFNRGENVEPKDILLVGDRILTDIVMANCFGMKSCLVQPFDISDGFSGVIDNSLVKLSR